MAKGEHKKGRENKKPKQAGGGKAAKSDYQTRQNTASSTTPFKIKKG
jgi:hypothetical protein